MREVMEKRKSPRKSSRSCRQHNPPLHAAVPSADYASLGNICAALAAAEATASRHLADHERRRLWGAWGGGTVFVVVAGLACQWAQRPLWSTPIWSTRLLCQLRILTVVVRMQADREDPGETSANSHVELCSGRVG